MELERLLMREEHPWVNGEVNTEENDYLLGGNLDSYGDTSCNNNSINSAAYDSMKDHVALPIDGGR